MYILFKIYVLINLFLIKIFFKIIECEIVIENNIIIMVFVDVCGLKINQLKNSFFSDFGGLFIYLLDDVLILIINFIVFYDIDVRK